MKKKEYLFLLMLTASFAACSSYDEEQAATTGTTLLIEVSEEPMTYTVGSRSVGTRSAVYTMGNVNTLYLSDNRTTETDGILNLEIHREGYRWTVQDYNWPSSMENVSFFSWNTRSELQYDAGYYYIPHAVEQNASSQTDLLVATTTVPKNSSRIQLSFNHACAAVNFTISKTEKLRDCQVIVKKVKLHNIIDEGDYYIGRANPWVYRNSKTYYTIRSTEGEVIGTDPTPLMAANDYMFMIPQSLTAWDKSSNLQNCYFSIECTINGTIEAKPINFNGTAYIPFAPAWEAGTMYTVDILLGTGLRDGSGNKIF